MGLTELQFPFKNDEASTQTETGCDIKNSTSNFDEHASELCACNSRGVECSPGQGSLFIVHPEDLRGEFATIRRCAFPSFVGNS